MSARENLVFWGKMYGLSGAVLQKRVDEVLELITLVDRQKDRVEKYSGGMKRRVNIGVALLHRPRVLYLDEPTVGIDPQARLHILGLVRKIVDEGTTVLYTTHYLHEAEELCQRLAIIDHGRILAEGTLEDLRAAVGGRDLVTLRGRFDTALARRFTSDLEGAEKLTIKEDEVVLSLPHGSDAIGRLLRGLGQLGETREVNIRQPSLENLFIKLTGQELRE
jgi:ABC-2 type transport system ATP-binding protein